LDRAAAISGSFRLLGSPALAWLKPLNDSSATSQITGTELAQPIRVLFVPN